jgi:hypothetical protein
MSSIKKIMLALTAVTLLSACSSTSNTNETVNAGYLSDYSQLKSVDVDDDSIVTRYSSSTIDKTKYDSILIETIDFYPALPQSSQISPEVAQQIKQQIDNNMRSTFAKSYVITDKPSESTAILRVAITGLTIDDKELAAYQYIPISFLITAATGQLNDMSVKLQIDAELIDSKSGQVIGAFTKLDEGEALANDETQLTLENLEPLLTRWFKSLDKALNS